MIFLESTTRYQCQEANRGPQVGTIKNLKRGVAAFLARFWPVLGLGWG